jgi:hypothetical protein
LEEHPVELWSSCKSGLGERSSSKRRVSWPAAVKVEGLIRINIKIKFVVNNYNYLSYVLFNLLNILTHT